MNNPSRILEDVEQRLNHISETCEDESLELELEDITEDVKVSLVQIRIDELSLGAKRVLNCMYRKDETIPTNIAHSIGMRRQNASANIQELKKQGLVRQLDREEMSVNDKRVRQYKPVHDFEVVEQFLNFGQGGGIK